MRRLRLFAAALMLLILSAAVTGYAQQAPNPILTVGQPSVGQIVQSTDVLRFDYTLTGAKAVTLQVLSENIHAAIRVVQNGAVIADQPNAAGDAVAVLNAVLAAGTYQVEVSASNGATGNLIVLVESEVDIVPQVLAPAAGIQSNTGASALALYVFQGLDEPANVLIFTDLTDHGVNARLTDPLTGQVIAVLSSATLGGRIHLPTGIRTYQLEITPSAPGQADPYTICFTPAALNTCDTVMIQDSNVGGQPVPTAIPPVTTPEVSASGTICTITPIPAGGVNIRQSANVQAQILGALPGGQFADVIGISPDTAFYNVKYGTVFGWVSAAVVTTQGDCAALQTIQPPAPIIPVQPTATPLPAQPTQPPAPPTAVPPSGPCLITINTPTYVYSIPNTDISNLYDQTQNSYQLIPTGRLADNSWWHTNYGGAWIQTSTFGSSATVTGDCSGLPIVSP
ncbi:MAG: SH3 domain-containing protein [Anaerolineae bacterium]